ncbi:NAD(P)/FAD-dependent oxidoreductase [Microbacterium sp. APC 3898]|uniref:NAD(P)/FAD-dependent oxidoreductase n=1 Tax=Planococcus notacanthi TaxID=3035188 RepID=A0ABT7ZGS6_9BACL|nr:MULTISPECIES: NAD(P)/FAD-dependent oxidoreductase [Terrabacteria group]MDN3426344.1 NAD(P)/FAD-dependent oxidoreductase [Planococcus sp. APC 4016]MDN3498040.1 NAD(P)/FAD-dependent oxidoreductase [Microbacterium sp. APC 3898]
MIMDCAVIGGGPAGLNASLVLGRARKKTVLFDDNKPRNAVTSEAHGFITRDGINPQELKRIAQDELANYPDIQIEKQRVQNIVKEQELFHIETEQGDHFKARKVILATGFKEVLPAIDRLNEFYGKSLFSCPFCDGWELRDRPLVVLAEIPGSFHMAKVASNWTDDLIVCTNGKTVLSIEDKEILEKNSIKVNEKKVSSLSGTNGKLEAIEFEDGERLFRTGGFVASEWVQASGFGTSLGCALNERGGVEADRFQRTNVEGVFACGDTVMDGPSQLIIAAAEGSMAGIGVNGELLEEKFKNKESLKTIQN